MLEALCVLISLGIRVVLGVDILHLIDSFIEVLLAESLNVLFLWRKWVLLLSFFIDLLLAGFWVCRSISRLISGRLLLLGSFVFSWLFVSISCGLGILINLLHSLLVLLLLLGLFS